MSVLPARSSALLTLARGLLQIFYPNLCWVCRQPIAPEQRALCRECRKALFVDPRPSCPRCAATVGPFAVYSDGCLACKAERFAFDAALRVGPYQGLLRDVVLRIKSSGGEGLAEIVGAEWAAGAVPLLRSLGIQSVVPIPLHWTRRWQRRCNQCDALARALAKQLQVPFHPYGLRRLRRTQMQSELTVTQRRANVRGAFQARRGIAFGDKTVLLVDDVMTTGSTAHEAARALRLAGTARIVVAVLARAEA